MITVVGEALIDLVPLADGSGYAARPGGSPYNVAIGLARLEAETTLLARLGADAFGRRLRGNAEREGIDLSAAPRAAEPTSLAVVSLDADAQATYDFYLDATAEAGWTVADVAHLPSHQEVLHFGSIASWRPPGDTVVRELAGRARGAGSLITYDPNVRPLLMGEPAPARRHVEGAIALAHVVKASSEDVAWLHPGVPVADVARRWLALGPHVVVVTDGGRGCLAVTRAGDEVRRAARAVALVDTVGAGDAFMAGLIAALVRAGVASPAATAIIAPEVLDGVLDFAGLVAALTCQRAGADPPRLAEVLANTPTE